MEPDEGILNLQLSYDDNYTTEPVLDEYTLKMAAVLRRAKIASPAHKQTITCACGMLVTNWDYLLPGGIRTNRLAVHILAHHRSLVSSQELEKISRVVLAYDPEEEPPPAQEELTPRKR